MKKFLLFVFVCLLIVGLSACGGAKKTDQGDNGQAFSGSVLDLLKLGKSSKCVLSARADATIMNGTTYISGTKARSDYEMKGPNNEILKGHYITDGTWMYVWTEGAMATAMKIKMDEMQASTDGKPGVESSDLSNFQDAMDYKCYGWTADQSVFTPPANLKFIDYSELMNSLKNLGQGIPGSAGSGNSALCGQCDNISDAATKAQCKKSLGCK